MRFWISLILMILYHKASMDRRLWDCIENSKAVCFGYDFEVCSAKILSKDMLSMRKKNFFGS